MSAAIGRARSLSPWTSSASRSVVMRLGRTGAFIPPDCRTVAPGPRSSQDESGCAFLSPFSRLLEHRFHVDLDLHAFADKEPARLEYLVPAHREVFTVDLGLSEKAGA